MLNGNGFYIWQIKDCPINKTIEFLKRSKAKWVSIKAGDGLSRMNQVSPQGKQIGNDSYLLEYINKLRENGISVGGWHYVYTKSTANAGGQAGLAGERVQKLHLDHWLIDAEEDGGGGWKTDPNRGTDAKIYMNQLQSAGVAKSVPIALSSYRFPSAHPQFPWLQFTNHDRMGFVAQQMYWLQSHNPREQLVRSIAEYNQIRARESKSLLPFVPIGSVFGYGDWEPGVPDIKEFVAACKEFGLPGYGWWSMDWVIKYNRVDWLDAMVGSVVVDPPTPEPDPEPEPNPEPLPETYFAVMNVGGMSVRSTPVFDVLNRNVFATGKLGGKVEVIGEAENGYVPVKAYVWEKSLKRV